MENKNLLILFAKNPVKGQVKTRLALELGEAKTLKVYMKLLDYTMSILSQIQGIDIKVYYSEFLPQEPGFPTCLQSKGDLGEKMLKAFKENFKQDYNKIVIIGSDCPKLRTDHIYESFQRLNDKPIVIGPAEDGGYYLLGMNSLHESIFEDKPWSTSELLDHTIHTMLEKQIPYTLLEVLDDIDTLQDLKKHPNFMV